ncbi:arginine kinase [Stylonychia lemnae]|uniref:Arginine kinase n=1 Tax=Stylonychia lemnae TaxID=5949 RepID=A0A078A152_STYLE|nr:arginine kinase [Stylonychia lemnae]|eukprot:CDW75971.1 arginine kinase [Stylonychia lemnae]
MGCSSGKDVQDTAYTGPTTLVGSHLKTAEDVVDYPHFPDGTKSLLKKHLTPAIWNELKDKQDKHGFTFKQAIFSGCKNTDSGIGVYAGSHDSYAAFAPLMDKIILDYHKHGKSAKHVSDMDASKLKAPPFAPEDAAMIVSTRIRVGRNLADYPLGPGLSKQQRLDIMNTVVKALETFEGDLQGKFYPLQGMSKDVQNKLIEDHFLFKQVSTPLQTARERFKDLDKMQYLMNLCVAVLDIIKIRRVNALGQSPFIYIMTRRNIRGIKVLEGDRFLEACNLNREWPEGRGIFHNDEKTFLVWVNEEDQLRIISMQQGADLHKVFERLQRATTHIEKVAKFAHDSHLGYITSCPTNLGTALRASVHIRLPKLSQRWDEFQKIADEFYVQIRGIHGEHSESTDATYDISNKRRLGRSEKDLVQDMYNGVKKMIEREKQL